MEFVGGGDLSQKIRECRRKRIHLKEEVIWRYFVQTLGGLKALHRSSIVHRDVKTANIFLSSDLRTAKLGDMNVAKVVKNDLAKTQIGTPYYLAPEIWNNKLYDYRCDVFSLGCVCRNLKTTMKFEKIYETFIDLNICNCESNEKCLKWQAFACPLKEIRSRNCTAKSTRASLQRSLRVTLRSFTQ